MAPHQSNRFIPRSRVSKSGFVDVYDIPAEKWVKRNAIDVREGLQAGTLSLDGPMVEMTGPGGPVKVPATEVKRRLQAGYKVVNEDEAKKGLPPKNLGQDPESLKTNEGESSKPANNEDSTPSNPAAYDFSGHNVSELKQFAKQAKIEGGDSMKKDELIGKLVESGWQPA